MGIEEYRPFRQPMIRIGFWKDIRSPDWFEYLPDPREHVDPNWSLGEREVIAAYLDSGKTFESWMGMSYCRFACGVFLTGNRDLTDGTYVWPEDLSHYIRVHSVQLPKEFLDHAQRCLHSDLVTTTCEKCDHPRLRHGRGGFCYDGPCRCYLA